MSASTANFTTLKVAKISKLWWVGTVAALSAAVANVVVYFVAQAVLGGPIVMPYQGPGTAALPLPLAPVIFASLIPALGATVLLGLLGRFTRYPAQIFLAVSVVFLLFSLGGPFSLPIALALQLALVVMHIVAGVATVGVLVTLGKE